MRRQLGLPSQTAVEGPSYKRAASPGERAEYYDGD